MLPTLPQTIIKKAEEYLVKVLRPGSEAKNFSGMRAEVFHHTKGSSQQKLPQTSQGLLPHIKRSFYNAYNIIHALDVNLTNENTTLLRPEDFGYKNDRESQFVPETSWNNLEPRWTVVCNCKACSMVTCLCRAAEVGCINFCGCKKKIKHFL